jgi:YVTN family beta-propeller protein
VNKYRLVFVIGLMLSAALLVYAQGDRPLYNLPAANVRVVPSGSIALAGDGRTLIAANMLNDTMSIVDLAQRLLLAEIAVGDDPRSVAFTSDAALGLVVNRASGTLSVIDMAERVEVTAYPVGVLPYAVVAADDTSAYVTVQGSSEVVHLDVLTGDVLDRIPVPAFPAGLTVWGDFLYVSHLWSGELSLIHLPQNTLVQTVHTGAALSQAVAVDPTTGRAYLPQSRLYADNPAPTYDSRVLPVVNVMDLGTLRRDGRYALDYADRPVNMPFAAAVDTVRDWLYVVNAGSDDLSVIDLNTGLALAHLQVGANPRGVLLNRDSSVLYVHNMIDGSLTAIATRTLERIEVFPISELTVSVDVLLGAQLFHSANDPRMAHAPYISCASCHFDGLSDGRVWDYNTPVLYGLADTAPYGWIGEWGSLAAVETKIRALQAGTGLLEDLHDASSLDMDTLVTYLLELPRPPAPTAPAGARGAELFTELGCAECHTGEGGQSYDVGTGGTFDTPTLDWLWLSAPYFHDGRAATLRDVFILPGEHQRVADLTTDDLDTLIAYLLALPQED